MSTKTVVFALESIRQRPLMFLRRISVRDLESFLTGYSFGLDVAEPSGFPHGNELRRFHDWIRTRTGEQFLAGERDRRTVLEVEDLLLQETDQDDGRAFALFFTLWDEFRSHKDPWSEE